MTNALVNTRNIILNTATSSSTSYNTNYAICRSNHATSVEVKCSLPSSLKNFKSITDVLLTQPTNLNSYDTNINLFIDSDYAVSGSYLPKGQGKLIHLDAHAQWLLSANSIVEYSLEAGRTPSGNSVEAVIPPSSCFNLTLKESITTISIPFSVQTKLRSEDTGSFIQDLTLSGVVTANILDTDYSEVLPCN